MTSIKGKWHVIFKENKWWVSNKHNTASSVGSIATTHETKKKAIDHAKKVAKLGQAEVHIYDKSGKLQKELDYKNYNRFESLDTSLSNISQGLVMPNIHSNIMDLHSRTAKSAALALSQSYHGAIGYNHIGGLLKSHKAVLDNYFKLNKMFANHYDMHGLIRGMASTPLQSKLNQISALTSVNKQLEFIRKNNPSLATLSALKPSNEISSLSAALDKLKLDNPLFELDKSKVLGPLTSSLEDFRSINELLDLRNNKSSFKLFPQVEKLVLDTHVLGATANTAEYLIKEELGKIDDNEKGKILDNIQNISEELKDDINTLDIEKISKEVKDFSKKDIIENITHYPDIENIMNKEIEDIEDIQRELKEFIKTNIEQQNTNKTKAKK